MPQKIVIISVFGHRNKGDAAIFQSLYWHVTRFAPEADVTVVARFPEKEREVYPDIRFEEQLLRSEARNDIGKMFEVLWFALGSLLWLLWRRAGRFVLPARKCTSLAVLEETDLVLSCGGGFLHDSIRGYVVHLFEMAVVKLLGKRLNLVAQSIGPFRTARSQFLARHVLNRVDLILCREEISRRYLREVLRLTRPTIGIIPDLAFAEVPSRRPEDARSLRARTGFPEGGVIVGLTVRHWFFPEDSSKAYELNSKFQFELAKFLDMIHDKYGFFTVFLPQTVTESFGSKDDRSVSLSIAQRVSCEGKVFVVRDDLSVSVLRRLVSECDLFVGTRMHSNIFALSSMVPTLAVSYLPKTEGVMRFIGLEDMVVPITSSAEEIMSAFDRLVERQDGIRTQLQEVMPGIRAGIEKELQLVLHGPAEVG